MQGHNAGGLGAAPPRGPDPSPRHLSTDSDMDIQGLLPTRAAPGAGSGPGASNAGTADGIAPAPSPPGGTPAPSDPMALIFTLALELHNRLSGEEAVSALQAKQLGALMEASGALHRRVDALERGVRTEVEALRGEAAAAASAARQAGMAASVLHGRVAAAEQEAARAKAALLTAQCELRALTGTVMQLISVAESHAAALRRGLPDKLMPAAAENAQRDGNGNAANWDPQGSGNTDQGGGQVPN